MDEVHILTAFRQPETRNAAFRAIVEHYQSRIYHHLFRMVGQAEDAADLTQEVFIRVWKSLDGFEGRSKLYTWIYRIATNEALAFLEKKQRMRAIPLDEVQFSTGKDLKASAEMDGDAIQRSLQLAIDALPPKQRQVFLLRYYEEMPYAEMAEALGTSEGALKASYHHAVRKIQETLGNQQQ